MKRREGLGREEKGRGVVFQWGSHHADTDTDTDKDTDTDADK